MNKYLYIWFVWLLVYNKPQNGWTNQAQIYLTFCMTLGSAGGMTGRNRKIVYGKIVHGKIVHGKIVHGKIVRGKKF